MSNYTILEGKELENAMNGCYVPTKVRERTEMLQGISGYHVVVFVWRDDIHVGILHESTGMIFYDRVEGRKYATLQPYKDPCQYLDYNTEGEFAKWASDRGIVLLPEPKRFSKLTQKSIDSWAAYQEQCADLYKQFNDWRKQDAESKKDRASKRLAAAGFKQNPRNPNFWIKTDKGIECSVTIDSNGCAHRDFSLAWGYLDLPDFCPDVNKD